MFWAHAQVEAKEVELGIDLGARGHEVRKLLWAGFSGLMQSQRYDPEDVLQEVYRGILTRNRGKCPWDPRKSTFGHYVHMVITCVLRNYHRKEQTRLSKIPCSTDEVDGVGVEESTDLDRSLRDLEGYLRKKGGPLLDTSILCLPLMVEGWTQDQMAAKLRVSKHVISNSVRWIRECASAWYV